MFDGVNLPAPYARLQVQGEGRRCQQYLDVGYLHDCRGPPGPLTPRACASQGPNREGLASDVGAVCRVPGARIGAPDRAKNDSEGHPERLEQHGRDVLSVRRRRDCEVDLSLRVDFAQRSSATAAADRAELLSGRDEQQQREPEVGQQLQPRHLPALALVPESDQRTYRSDEESEAPEHLEPAVFSNESVRDGLRRATQALGASANINLDYLRRK